MLFYRYPVIYQQITMTPEEPVVVDVEDSIVDDVAMVVRPDVFYSSTVKAEEIPVIDSGWVQTFNPPLVPARVVAPSSISFVDDVVVVVVEEPGWNQAYNPPLVPPRIIPPSDSVIDLGEDSEEFPIVDDVPMVLRRDVFYSETVKAEEIPLIESGWDQAFNPPLVPARIIPPSSLVFTDEVAIIDTGWIQAFNPPLVPARIIPPSSLAFTDEVAIVDSGFIQAPDNPPLFIFAARFLPESSTVIETGPEPAPAVVAVRMRLLGGGLLKRKQLG